MSCDNSGRKLGIIGLTSRLTSIPQALMVADNSTMSTEPQLARGGILADDMGLGKTLQYQLSER